jgi:hypothetical protein
MDHIVRDLIVRWQRTVIFVVLTAIGLMIWVTCFVHSVLEKPNRNRSLSEAAGSTSKTSPNTVSLFQEKRFLNESPESVSVKQDLLNRRQQADPLARSIEVSAVHSNDFRTRIKPLSISVSISGDDKDAPTAMRHANPSFRSTSELKLAETFTDENPRRAVVNEKQYVEGTQIQIGNRTYRLTNIRRNSIELIRNDEIIVLRLHK